MPMAGISIFSELASALRRTMSPVRKDGAAGNAAASAAATASHNNGGGSSSGGGVSGGGNSRVFQATGEAPTEPKPHSVSKARLKKKKTDARQASSSLPRGETKETPATSSTCASPSSSGKTRRVRPVAASPKARLQGRESEPVTPPEDDMAKMPLKAVRSAEPAYSPSSGVTDIHPELTLEQVKQGLARYRHPRQHAADDDTSLEINTMFALDPSSARFSRPRFRDGRRSTLHASAADPRGRQRRCSVAVMAPTTDGQRYSIKSFPHSSTKLHPQSSSAVHYLAISPPRIHITDERGVTSPDREHIRRSFEEKEEGSTREGGEGSKKVCWGDDGSQVERDESQSQRTKCLSSGANQEGGSCDAREAEEIDEGEEGEEEDRSSDRRSSFQEVSSSSPIASVSPQVSPAVEQHPCHHQQQPQRPYTLLGRSRGGAEDSLSRTSATSASASSPNSASSGKIIPSTSSSSSNNNTSTSSSSTSSGPPNAPAAAVSRSTSNSGSSWSRRQSSTDQTTFSSRSVWSSKRSR